jgi:hypothetical protein
LEAGARKKENWTNGRIAGMSFAVLAGLIGLAFLLAGLFAMGAHFFARDSDGYYTTDAEVLETSAYAIRTEEINLGADDLKWAEGLLGDVRIRVEAAGPIFLGIGPDAAVAAYLRGVGQDEVTDWGDRKIEYDRTPGGPPRTRPGSRHFWVAQASGRGTQELVWDADFGRWSAVVMNADGSRGVSVEADAGIKIGWLIWVGLGLFLIGVIVDGAAIALMLMIIRRAESKPATG